MSAAAYRENGSREQMPWGTYTTSFHINDTAASRMPTDSHTLQWEREKKIRQDCELCHKEQ